MYYCLSNTVILKYLFIMKYDQYLTHNLQHLPTTISLAAAKSASIKLHKFCLVKSNTLVSVISYKEMYTMKFYFFHNVLIFGYSYTKILTKTVQ